MESGEDTDWSGEDSGRLGKHRSSQMTQRDSGARSQGDGKAAPEEGGRNSKVPPRLVFTFSGQQQLFRENTQLFQ